MKSPGCNSSVHICIRSHGEFRAVHLYIYLSSLLLNLRLNWDPLACSYHVLKTLRSAPPQNQHIPLLGTRNIIDSKGPFWWGYMLVSREGTTVDKQDPTTVGILVPDQKPYWEIAWRTSAPHNPLGILGLHTVSSCRFRLSWGTYGHCHCWNVTSIFIEQIPSIIDLPGT